MLSHMFSPLSASWHTNNREKTGVGHGYHRYHLKASWAELTEPPRIWYLHDSEGRFSLADRKEADEYQEVRFIEKTLTSEVALVARNMKNFPGCAVA